MREASGGVRALARGQWEAMIGVIFEEILIQPIEIKGQLTPIWIYGDRKSPP